MSDTENDWNPEAINALRASDEEDKALQLRSTMLEHSDSDPEKAAKALPIAQAQGLPLQTVEADLPTFQKQEDWTPEAINKLRETTPILADFLAEPDHARLAHDDVGPLWSVSDFFSNPGPYVARTGQNLLAGGVQGVGMAESYIGGAMQRGSQALMDKQVERGTVNVSNTALLGTTALVGEILSASGWGFKEVGKKMTPKDAGLFDMVMQGLGQVIPEIGVSMMTGGAGSGALLATAQMADQGYDEAVQQGKAGLTAEAAAVLYGTATYGTERLGLEALIQGLPAPAKKVVGDFMVDAARKLGIKPDGKIVNVAGKVADTGFRAASEATQEGSEQYLQNLVDKWVLGENKPASDQVGINAEVGGIVGGLVGAFFNSLFHAKVSLQQNYEKSVQRELENGRKLVGKAALQERSPDKMNELLRAHTGEANVYITPHAVNTFYQAMSPEDQASLNASIPGFEDRLTTALTEGSDMEINRADYHTYVQPHDTAKALDEYARLVPEASSPGDRAEYDQHILELYGLHGEDQQGQTEGEAVQSNFYNQLLQRFGERVAPSGKVDTARLLAENPRAFYETMMERSGGDPKVAKLLEPLLNLKIVRHIPNLGAFLQKGDFDLQIDQARNMVKENRAKAQKPKKRDLFGKTKTREKATPKPVHNWLSGRIKSGSPAAALLREFPDIKASPSGTITGLDNLPYSEMVNALPEVPIKAQDSADNQAQYVDQWDLLDRLKDEAIGKGTADTETQAKDSQKEYLRQLAEAVDMAGIDIETASNAEIRQALQLRHEAQELSGTGPVTFYQAAQNVEKTMNGMRSGLMGAAVQLKQAKGTGAQMLAMLQKAPGVKAEELAWTGLDTFLTEKGKDTVTKSEIMDYLAANKVQVVPVVLGGDEENYGLKDGADPEFDIGLAPYDVIGIVAKTKSIDVDKNTKYLNFLGYKDAQKMAEWIAENVESKGTYSPNTKFQQYTLPGGENYREVLLTLPDERPSGRTGKFVIVRGDLNDAPITKPYATREVAEQALSSSTPDEIERYGLRIKEVETDKPAFELPKFQSSHFDQPNVLAHLRLNDRTDSDGKRVLFIEEVQSDWHQSGRKKGYSSADGRKAVEALEKKKEEFLFDLRNKYGAGFTRDDLSSDEAAAIDKFRDELGNLQRDANGVPDAPFKKTWHEMAFRYAAQLAAQGNYDRVAWTTGEQQNDRFDLSKQVDEVAWEKNADGTIGISVFKNNDVVAEYENKTPAQLEDIIGKDLTQKIVNSSDNKDSYTGQQLRIGGTGMKGFYDKILPEYARKFGKKFGAQVNDTTVKTFETGGFDNFAAQHLRVYPNATVEETKAAYKKNKSFNLVTVHAMDITPDMRAEATTRGFELFQAGAVTAPPTLKTDTPEFKKWFGDSKVVDADGKPLVVYHGTFENFKKFNPDTQGRNVQSSDTGFFFTSSPQEASAYADPALWENRKNHGTVIPVYLSLKNPKIIDVGDYEPSRWYDQHGNKAHDDAVAQGHDGIILKGNEPHVAGERNAETYIAFEPEQIKSVFNRGTFDPNDPRILFQSGATTLNAGGPVEPRGSVQFLPDGNMVINLFAKEDLSTVLHELGHVYWKIMQDIAALPEATEQIKADVATMRAWVGAKEGERLTVDQEEKIADGFLAYLRDGEGPAAELQGAFSRFRGWLARIYRGVRDTLPGINDKVRGVFDRMLATDEAIEALARKPEFSIDPRIVALLPEAQAERMKRKYEKALEVAKNRLFHEAMKQAEKRNTKDWREAEAEVKAQVTEQVKTERAYTTIEAIRKAGGLNRKELVKIAGKEVLPYLSGHGGLVKAKGGAEPAAIAAVAGYSTAKDMLLELMNASPIKQRVAADTEAIMLQRYGDMLKDGTVEREALAAFHNNVRAELMQMEINMLAELAGIPAPTKDGIKAHAIKMLADKKVKDIRPDRHLKAENAAYFRYGKALGEKEFAKAATAKAQQLLNHYLYRMSLEAREDIDAKLAQWRRLLGKSDKKIGEARRLDIDYVYAARAILANYGLGRGTYDFTKWQAMLQSENPDLAEALSYAIAFNSEQAKPYKEMAWGDFQALADAVDNLIEVGKGQRFITIAGKKMELAEAVERLNTQAGGKKKTGLPSGYGRKLSERELKIIGLYGLKAKWRRVESWVTAMDGGASGPFRELVWNPVKNAATAYYESRQVYLKKMLDLLAPHKDRLHGEKILAPELVSEKTGEMYEFEDKGELIGMLLHTGNDSNLYKLLAGYGWDADSFHAFLDRAHAEGIITAEDWKLVQSLWDLAEELKPAVWRAHKDMYGFRPAEVTAAPVVTPFGEFRGGYWPAIVDTTKSDKAAQRADNEAIAKRDNFTAFPSTGRGATKSRVENFAEPLELSLRLLPSHIDWALRFVNIEPAVKDAGKIMINPDFRAAMKDIDPAVVQEMLVPWLQRTARQSLDMPKPGKGWRLINNAAGWLRRQAGLQIMMGNLVNASQQLTGLAPALYKVGGRQFQRAWVQFFGDMQGMTEKIYALDPSMKHRASIIDEDYLKAVSNIISPRTKYQKVKDFSQAHGYFAQRIMQGFVDKITWIAAYNKALDGEVDGVPGGNDEAAISYAGSVVRETQGSMNPEDVSDLESSTPMARLFTMFYSFFSGQGNMIATEAGRIKNSEAGAGSKAADVAMLYIMMLLIPGFLSDAIVAALRGKLPDDKDGDGSSVDEWLQFFAISQTRYATAMVPWVGQAAQVAIGAFTDTTYDDHISLSPAAGLLDTLLHNGPVSIYKAVAKDGDKSKAVGDALTMLGVVTGLPTAVIKKPAMYAADVAEGDQEPEGTLSTLRGLIGGPAPKK